MTCRIFVRALCAAAVLACSFGIPRRLPTATCKTCSKHHRNAGELARGLVASRDQALEQIVTSVKRVSDVVAEIAAASREQSAGIEQVNSAVMQMDEMTTECSRS